MNKIIKQDISQTYKVLYTSSGVHIAATVINRDKIELMIHDRTAMGFVQDSSNYGFDAFSAEEAHYLCALLNAPCVDEAIKNYQPRGKGNVGQRHIQRTPFEACAIPPFDALDRDHMALAKLSMAAHEAIKDLKLMDGLKGGVVTIRRKARAEVDDQIQAIDVIARRVIGLDEIENE